MLRKTKIVCTLGPSTDDENVMRSLIEEGMNVARFNFSHGGHEEQFGRLTMLRKLREEMKRPVAALLDTKGPEIRLKEFASGKVELKNGQTFTLTTEDIVGDESRVAITYKDLPDDVKPGDTILIDDGLIGLEVKKIQKVSGTKARFSFVLLLAIPAWLCSLFGFGKLIGTVYPICGALGALALLGLLHHRFTLRAPK